MRRRGPERRADKAGTAFLVLWMTVWLSAILVAVWTMGAAALSGEAGAAIVLLVWVGAALFGLVSATRALRARLLGERPGPRPHRNHRWNDGLDAPAPPPAGEAAGGADAPPPPPPPLAGPTPASSSGRRS
jgi:hypothetical protein